MADEKREPEVEATATATATAPVLNADGTIQRPPGWMYKGFKIGKTEVWYASPIFQLILVAMVCFLCPGMFNAITGLGGGGQVDPTVNDHANTALYSTFAVTAFFSGTIANMLGVKLTLSFGGLGYCIYSASLLSYNHNQNKGFVIFAGAFLGVCAGLLWTAQGTIMMSYPSEERKGRYISWFWIIFNLGAVIGSLIPLGQNIHKKAGPVTDGTYAGFIVLMFLGLILALFLCNANMVLRRDGSKVILMKNPTWKSELLGLVETITSQPWIILLFPMFFASNVFYTYQGSCMNALYFNVRTRSLNNTLYWSSQILSAVIFGYALDYGRIGRTVRARANFVVLFVLTMVVWGGGYDWQKQQPSRDELAKTDADGNSTYTTVDWTDGGKKFIAPMFLYIFYGFLTRRGRPASTGTWELCPTLVASQPTLPASTRLSNLPVPPSSGPWTPISLIATRKLAPPGVFSPVLYSLQALSSGSRSRIPSPSRRTSSSVTRRSRTSHLLRP